MHGQKTLRTSIAHLVHFEIVDTPACPLCRVFFLVSETSRKLLARVHTTCCVEPELERKVVDVTRVQFVNVVRVLRGRRYGDMSALYH